jgi:hypothetical protein
VVPLGIMETTVKYHPHDGGALTRSFESVIWTPAGGQFDWGGRLPKGNGGARRFPQRGRQSRGECKGKREPDCESDGSNSCESRS